MAEYKKLKPNPEIEGALVRDENRVPLPKEGREVTMNAFWERKLREGDVVEVKAQAAPAPARVEEQPKAPEHRTTEKGGSK
jgi:hypothetical protein